MWLCRTSVSAEVLTEAEALNEVMGEGRWNWFFAIKLFAGVVKLVNTHGSEPCGRKALRVQVSPPAPFFARKSEECPIESFTRRRATYVV